MKNTVSEEYFLTDEYYESLPQEVREILDQSTGDIDYELCAYQVRQLNAIGWDGSYYLDGGIHSVWKLDVEK